MTYSLEFRPSVLKSLRRFPKRDLVRLKKKMEGLANNLPSTKITKMKGDNPFIKFEQATTASFMKFMKTNC